MTTQRAIGKLKWYKKYLCKDSLVKIYDMAIEALKKQKPMELVLVKHANRVPSEQFVSHCPNCDANCESFISYGYKYCPYCGQAIKGFNCRMEYN